ncbi:M17 family metallopeptidase [Dongshaea marina]|uniref:M17 family metallopeptidase n=1 Tax=Dongshaea marina TaxID=2047966 RepID=UPI000D3EC738|nr:leucyl aminopeptidase family protein [Dongshaea marina]
MEFGLLRWVDSPSLKEQHLIGFGSSLQEWLTASSFHGIAPLLRELHEHGGGTCKFGLGSVCRRLTLLEGDSPDHTECCAKALKEVEQLELGHLCSLTFSLLGLELESPDTYRGVLRLLVALGNRDYRLSDLGYHQNKESKSKLVISLLATDAQLDRAYQLCHTADAITQGMIVARELADRPSQDCTPQSIANWVEEYCSEKLSLSYQILDEAAMLRKKMGALYAVGKGSCNPPRLVTLSYRGKGSEALHHVFVGKGVTFDTGGLWLKPGEGMRTMKYDMCGAASLLGLMDTVYRLQLPVNLSVVLALAENMPTATAMRPGDVVQTHAGYRVEIINTDAEGRLVLADALSYAARELKADLLIDVATLTGAAVKALGYDISALMGNDEELLRWLESAGEHSGDRVWRLPLDESFESQVGSEIADLCNTPPNNAAISVSAAYFLGKFCDGRRWAHLDVSGTALTRGDAIRASGRPIPLLIQYLCDRVQGTNNGVSDEEDPVSV